MLIRLNILILFKQFAHTIKGVNERLQGDKYVYD